MDVGKGIMCFTTPPGSRYEFPKGKRKNRSGKNKFTGSNANAPPLENT